jgi:hypothetical protein
MQLGVDVYNLVFTMLEALAEIEDESHTSLFQLASH